LDKKKRHTQKTQVVVDKKSKKNPLTKADKKQNHRLSSSRVMIENLIREVKIFRIVAEKYRNRRNQFGLRFNLIAAVLNLNINVKRRCSRYGAKIKQTIINQQPVRSLFLFFNQYKSNQYAHYQCHQH